MRQESHFAAFLCFFPPPLSEARISCRTLQSSRRSCDIILFQSCDPSLPQTLLNNLYKTRHTHKTQFSPFPLGAKADSLPPLLSLPPPTTPDLRAFSTAEILSAFVKLTVKITWKVENCLLQTPGDRGRREKKSLARRFIKSRSGAYFKQVRGFHKSRTITPRSGTSTLPPAPFPSFHPPFYANPDSSQYLDIFLICEILMYANLKLLYN